MRVYYCEELDQLVIALPYNLYECTNKTYVRDAILFKRNIIIRERKNPMIQYLYKYIGKFIE
jgi:hypothetical protein